ncbi:MAG: VWA domain-containing protein [Bdellovibrionales bacterium]|nr:VWA domain-containing protein [Bdellovibrionales bacterium]
MDFLEGVFKKIWKTKREKELSDLSCCQLNLIENYLNTVFSYSLPKSSKLTLHPSLKTFAVWNRDVFMPDRVNIFNDRYLNKRVYFYMALKALGLFAIKKEDWREEKSKRAGVLATLKNMHMINLWLNQEFPTFRYFESTILEEFRLSKFRKQDDFFVLWDQRVDSIKEPTDENICQIEKLRNKQKRNDTLPTYLLFSVPIFLPNTSENLDVNSSSSVPRVDRKNSEQQSGYNKPVKKVSLDKESANPVIHSFEKMETVDEFEKSGRHNDGDDELQKHNSAMNEIEMGHITVDGETSQSVYKSDIILSFATSYAQHRKVSGQFTYPEWDDKHQRYLKEYCALYVSSAEHKGTKIINTNLIERQRNNKWKKKITQIFNQPKWRKGLLEGTEIDIDKWCTSFTDFRSGHTPNQKIFSEKRKRHNYFALSVLFDQSLSTDSWIENEHIIEAIRFGLLSLSELLEKFCHQIMVAGTFSVTRRNCNLIVYKSFSDNWTFYKEKIASVDPQGYTRLGPAIRHVKNELVAKSAKKKILLLITDGKPTDLDYYEGHHGIYDVRKARIEAESQGVEFVAIVLDKKKRTYFSDMFSHYDIIQSPSEFQESFFKLIYSCLK